MKTRGQVSQHTSPKHGVEKCREAAKRKLGRSQSQSKLSPMMRRVAYDRVVFWAPLLLAHQSHSCSQTNCSAHFSLSIPCRKCKYSSHWPATSIVCSHSRRDAESKLAHNLVFGNGMRSVPLGGFALWLHHAQGAGREMPLLKQTNDGIELMAIPSLSAREFSRGFSFPFPYLHLVALLDPASNHYAQWSET